MEDFNKYRRILYKKWRENTIMNEDTHLREVIIEAACNFYIIIIPIADDKEKENWYKQVAR